MVGLTASGSVAGVGVVALAARATAAGRTRWLEPVVVTGSGQTGVLVRTLRPGVAAVGSVGHVVGLTGAAAVAGVGVVALAARGVTASSARRLGRVNTGAVGWVAGIVRAGVVIVADDVGCADALCHAVVVHHAGVGGAGVAVAAAVRRVVREDAVCHAVVVHAGVVRARVVVVADRRGTGVQLRRHDQVVAVALGPGP